MGSPLEDFLDEKGLEHSGVKGMRWGHRKSGHSSKTSSGKGGRLTSTPKVASKDYQSVATLRKKPLNQMSNKEIERLNKRLNLEKAYKQMNPNVLSRGKAALATGIGTVGMGITIYNMYNSPAGKAAISLGKKALG